MRKILTVIGARPQFIKAAMVSRALKQNVNMDEILVHTGQHYDDNMSKIFFDELDIPKVNYHLGIQAETHGQQTGQMIIAIEEVLKKEQPDWLLIYGDTNSTLAGAIAASKLHIPIAHVEAGLRSYNHKMPEEINRLVADRLAKALFTPTLQSVNNLLAEGYAKDNILQVGDVMFDAAIYYSEKAKQNSNILDKLNLIENKFILATVHRAENTDNPHKLLNIFAALEGLCHHKKVIMPLHPRTRKYLQTYNPDILKNTKIELIEPVGFLDMIMLEKNAALIITDSGGVQKEAFFYGVPCLTLRDETEWVETIELGWNRLAKTEESLIYNTALEALKKPGLSNQYPYGTGNASELIVNYLN